ncbi:hypothetical protein GCM10023259_103710 [Thermocatellispora tengchongensis]
MRDLIGDEVARALNSLPVDFRTVIILCDLEGFTYEEMAFDFWPGFRPKALPTATGSAPRPGI